MSNRQSSGKVIGVGLGRTGTTSLAAALDRLGFATIHYPSSASGPELASGSAFFDALENHEAIANGTGCPYQAIDTRYPGSKFILTIRDLTSWLRSKKDWAEMDLENWDRFTPDQQSAKRYVNEHVYGSFEFDADVWTKSYERHVASVMEHFQHRPADLLVLNIPAGDDWRQLCPFLGHSERDEPFPRRNDWNAVEKWREREGAVRLELSRHIPRDEPFLLIEDGSLQINDRRARILGQRDGTHWGPPANDTEAIVELEKAEADDIRFLAVAWVSFWWLEHYLEFSNLLQRRFTQISATEDLIVFARKHR